MAISNKKDGGVLLIQGLDVSKPGEYISEQSCTQCQNVEVFESLLKKRAGTSIRGGVIYTETLTIASGNANDTETVTIGAKTYTFQTSLTDVDGNVLIGATASDSLDNLIAAINLAAGAGSTYATSTTAHPNNTSPDVITASAGAGDTMVLTANLSATIATTETMSTGSFGNATMQSASGLEVMTGRQYSRQGVANNIRITLDKTEKFDASNAEWDDITLSGTDWTGDTDDIFDTAIPLLSGAEILCIANGKDAIQKYTGSGLCTALGGTPPVPKFIQEFKTYLVCANIQGGTDVSQRVQWSDTAAPETWGSGNAGSVDLVEDGEDITGLDLYGNYLCVHKPSSIYIGYLVSGSAIFQFDRRATGVGTVANNTIVNLPTGEQIFLAKDGLRIFNGITAPLIPSPINDELRSSMNAQKLHKAYGVLIKEKDEVWIGIPIGSQEYGYTIYKYNYTTGVLHKDLRDEASAMWRGASTNTQAWDDFGDSVTWDDVDLRWNDISFSTDAEQINIGNIDGFVEIVDTSVYLDVADTIDMIWDSKDFQVSQDVIGRFKKMELWATGEAISVYYSIDEGENWVEVSNSPLTLSSTMPQYTDPLVLYFDVLASKIRFRFRNQSTTSGYSMKQFIIEYTERGNRR